MKRLTNIRFNARDSLCKLKADWLNTVARRLDNIILVGGQVEIDSNKIILIPGNGFGEIDSFSFKKTDGALFYIYGGSIRWAGWTAYTLPDDTSVTITGGTVDSPGCVALRMRWAEGPSSTELVFVNAANPPDDDGTYGFKPLYQAWLVDGAAVCGRSKRHDWSIASPVGAI